jgi:endoglucanase
MSRLSSYLGPIAVLVIVAGCNAPGPPTAKPAPVEQEKSPTPMSTSATNVAAAAPVSATDGSLRTRGADIVDANGTVVRLTGVNWFGMETGTFVVHGLWARSLNDMLDQIVHSGFNTLRLPYSNELLEPKSVPTGIDFALNPDLQGLTGLQILDQVIVRAGERGLKVILDRHRPTAEAQSELWYTERVSEERWIADWVMLASRYRGNTTVIGADLHNEPRGPATWGDDNPRTDWRAAAERVGNAILEANPEWLIIVEGIERQGDDWYWWGGNLSMAGSMPVRLSAPDKLVYSAHDYGPGVFNQKWFAAPDFPRNLSDVWYSHWAYLKLNGIAPVLVGEFGGRSMGDDAEGIWQRELVTYLQANGFDYTYWCWNPNSGDTGGILDDNWTTLDDAKMGVLKGYQWPLIGSPQSSEAARAIIDAYQAPPVKPQAPAPASVPAAPAPSFAVGGPFDPDPQHAQQGIGGPGDPDPARRQARQADEQRYVELNGRPWERALYVTAVP